MTAAQSQTNLIILSVYILVLIGIGFLGRKFTQQKTLSDFFLSNRSMGMLVLFFTLYATQYSGNTVVGFAAKGYREGFWFISSTIFMMCIIGAYFLFAPRLQHLSRKKHYITGGDYLEDRFGSRRLVVLSSCVYIWALSTYIISNLKAAGYIVESITGGRINFVWGIIILAVVMLIYEMLGGMRAVAWTDALQGFLLLFGCIAIFIIFLNAQGGLTLLVQKLRQQSPDFWVPPDSSIKLKAASLIAVFYFGISMYPQAIQRIYAASSVATLKRSFQLMVFMPLFTTLPIVLMGIFGRVQYPSLSKLDSENITLRILTDLTSQGVFANFVILLFICAMVAAIMSTVDSALLSLTSIFTKDFYKKKHPQASDKMLLSMSKWVSLGIMALGVWAAISLPSTIWKLIEIKLEVLMQLSPAFMIGLASERLKETGVFYGALIGVVLVLVWQLLSLPECGIHPGVIGLGVNLVVLCIYELSHRNLGR